MAVYNLRTAQYEAKNPIVPTKWISQTSKSELVCAPVTRKSKMASSSRYPRYKRTLESESSDMRDIQ